MNRPLLDPLGLLLAMSGRLAPVPLVQIDCDELTAFLLTFAVFFDMPAEVVTVAADPARPDQFTHVYLRLHHRQGGRIPFDITAGPYPGSESLHFYRRRAWPLDTPVEPSDSPESDRSTAEAVAAVIASARASAAHPEFRRFLRALVQWLLENLSVLVGEEQERRGGGGKESSWASGEGEGRGEDFLRDLSEADLQSFGAWLAHCLTELQDDQVNVQRLLEVRPELSIPEPTAAQTTEWSRHLIDRVLAWVASSREGRPGTPPKA